MAVRKTRLTKRGKASGWKYPPPRLRMVPRGIARVSVKDSSQSSNPCHAFVTDVPDESETASNLQDPSDFVESRCVGEPVKGLCADDGIDGGVTERKAFSRTLLGFNPWIAIDQL